MPENVPIEEYVEHGIEIASNATEKIFSGDLVNFISEELKKQHPELDGRADKIARSLYWVLTDKLDSPLENLFWVNPLMQSNSIYSVSHEYRKNGKIDNKKIVKHVLDEYLTYITS